MNPPKGKTKIESEKVNRIGQNEFITNTEGKRQRKEGTKRGEREKNKTTTG